VIDITLKPGILLRERKSVLGIVGFYEDAQCRDYPLQEVVICGWSAC
jgi:hypothetical protein